MGGILKIWAVFAEQPKCWELLGVCIISSWRDLQVQVYVDRMRSHRSKLPLRKFRLNIRKYFLTMRTVEYS